MGSNSLSRSKKYVSTIGLILANIAFFYLFSIDMKGVLISSLYFVFAAVLPGYLIAKWFCETCHVNNAEKLPWHLMLGLSTIFGIGNVLLSYLVLQGLRSEIWKYFWLWPYLILIKYVFVRSRRRENLWKVININNWLLPITLLFILLVNVLNFQMRPTPGILPLDIFHDHVWNAGNTVSLVNGFPLRSMNIESKPSIAYHVLVHILGAHMAMITGLKAHLTGLQYVFIPLTPILILNMVALLHSLNIRKNGYLLYGLGVLLFGAGFAIVHEVKVGALLNSSTNFLGVILLFAVMTTWIDTMAFKPSGRFIVVFIGVFLATAAKGSIGTALVCGSLLWTILKLWKKSIGWSDGLECAGAILGFLGAYLLFFLFPVMGQGGPKDVLRATSFLSVPFSYVTKNALASPIIDLIYKYLHGMRQWVAYFILVIFMIPVHVLFYYTYRLFVVYKLRIEKLEEAQRRIISVIVGSLFVGYIINRGPADHAYFLNAGLFLLDVLFVFFISREGLFSRVREFYAKKEIFALVGAVFIFALPFLSMSGWIHEEHLYNFVMFGKIGQNFDSKLKGTNYRKSHQTITPEIYQCLQYIREWGDRDSIIVSPFADLPDGRHLAFWTSAFGERTAYLEGYEPGGESIIKYSGLSEVKRRVEIIEGIYKNYSVPKEMHNHKYLFIVKRTAKKEYEGRYLVDTLFENAEWSVVGIGDERRY